MLCIICPVVSDINVIYLFLFLQNQQICPLCKVLLFPCFAFLDNDMIEDSFPKKFQGHLKCLNISTPNKSKYCNYFC